jgi:dimethylargininase
MLIAITRAVSPALAACQLTHVERRSIDVERARAQHRDYERLLAEAGCRVERLDAGADIPDSVFIEDAAVVLDEMAIITMPGAPSRRPETAAVAARLRAYRDVLFIEPPGTIDGGDVLVVGKRVFVGCSSRTNLAAINQVRGLLAPYGYEVESVDVSGALHLKSTVTAVADNLLLMNASLLPDAPFADFDRITVDAAEPMAANALRVGGEVIYPESFPRTRERLQRRGLNVRAVDVAELQKAEGGVTCCSLVFAAGSDAGGGVLK